MTGKLPVRGIPAGVLESPGVRRKVDEVQKVMFYFLDIKTQLGSLCQPGRAGLVRIWGCE